MGRRLGALHLDQADIAQAIRRAASHQRVVRDESHRLDQRAGRRLVGAAGLILQLNPAIHVEGREPVLLRFAGQPFKHKANAVVPPPSRFATLHL